MAKDKLANYKDTDSMKDLSFAAEADLPEKKKELRQDFP